MIKTSKSAVTAISYGLIAALVAAVSLGALTATGVDIENIFLTTGNAMAATTVATPHLNSEQQSEIANAAAEIAAGTASAACLQYMSNATNVATMASSGATCLGPGLNIAPPQQPIKVFLPANNYSVFTYPDGQIYAAAVGDNQNVTSLNAQGVWFYNDGFVTNNENWVACSNFGSYGGDYSPSTTTTTQGTSISCTGGTSTGNTGGVVGNTNASQSAPMGYEMADTW